VHLTVAVNLAENNISNGSTKGRNARNSFELARMRPNLFRPSMRQEQEKGARAQGTDS
jgi:hypothetical protein